MSINSANTGASVQSAAAPVPIAPPTAAVSALVSRFTAPIGAHPPVEPSLTKAVVDCGGQVGMFAINVAAVAVMAPETGFASLLAFGRVAASGVTAAQCIARDEAAQVVAGTRANQSADCERDGGIALLKADGSVVCEVP